jgi:hypothetical protein
MLHIHTIHASIQFATALPLWPMARLNFACDFGHYCWGADLYTKFGSIPMDNYPVTAPLLPQGSNYPLPAEGYLLYFGTADCLLNKRGSAILPLMFDGSGWSGGYTGYAVKDQWNSDWNADPRPQRRENLTEMDIYYYSGQDAHLREYIEVS